MTDTPESPRPQWAGRVSRNKIQRLYERDAQGLPDEELIDEVGIALLARCEAILQATDQRRGEVVLCPECGEIVPRQEKEFEELICDCGWRLPWREYRKSFTKKQLSAGGIEPFLREYLEQYPKCRTHRHRMIQIDILIHRYHWELQGNPGRPGACNLIGGRQYEIWEFLQSLAYSDQSTPGLEQTYNRWRKQGRRQLRKIDQRRRKRAKQEEAAAEAASEEATPSGADTGPEPGD